ncbi:MAG TPA: protein kinase [Polyangiaceae bacterium]
MSEFREFQDGELIAGTRYRVVQLVGVGGMGSVYEVEHVELGKRFVLKALLRELARRDDLVARMRNEWRALARLQHPNIVNVTDAGTSGNGVPFYVMERLDGETLGARLKRARRLAVPDAIHVAASVLDGLSAAHDIGVVHRDVKPPNIFLLRDGTVKLLDFGVAKMADASSVITARGLAVGTPRYMSPEQARGDSVDGRSDVYASGLILFEMLAGAGPFDDARDSNELLLAHLARQAPRLSSMALGIAPELDEIVAGMLAKDHRERPARAATVAVSLRAFLAGRASAPATDAPTGQAFYSAQTAARPVPSSPERELETRADSPSRRSTLVMKDDTTTAQITLTLNTADETGSTQPTVIDAPVFGAHTTQIGASTTAPLGVSSRQGTSSAVTQPMLHTGPERVERTEILTGIVVPPQDAGPTRTRVPLVEPLQNLTPPPVVETRPTAQPVRRENTVVIAAAIAAAAAAVLFVAAIAFFALRRPTPSTSAAVTSRQVVATQVELPSPSALPEPPATPEPVAESSPAEVPSVAPVRSADPVPPAAPPKPVRQAPSAPPPGPFLAATLPKKPAPPAPQVSNRPQKPSESKFVLPASGL